MCYSQNSEKDSHNTCPEHRHQASIESMASHPQHPHLRLPPPGWHDPVLFGPRPLQGWPGDVSVLQLSSLAVVP